MSLALSKGTCGRTFEMANQNNGRAILCRRRASGRHHMDKTGRKTGNQWATKTGVAIDLGHGVFSHPPGIPLRGAWLGGV